MQSRNKIVKGAIIGLIVPLAGFLIVKLVFTILIKFGLFPDNSPGISERRLRTMSLLAICFNILPLQMIKKRINTNLIRGIVLMTLVYAFIWVIWFRESVFNF